MRKRIFRRLLACLLIACALQGVAFAETAVVTGSEVNVRSGPGMEYPILGSFVRGNSVEVVDRSDPAWYAVNFYGQVGYMSSGYLSVQTDSYATIAGGGNSASIAVPRQGSTVSTPPPATVTTPRPTAAPTPSSSGSALLITDWDSAGLVVAPPPAETPAPTPSERPVLVFTSPSPSLPSPSPAPTQAPAASPSPAPVSGAQSGRSGTIAGDYVRFRRGPDTSYPIIATYDRGQALTILSQEGSWTLCAIDGQAGYVFSQYVTADTAVTPQTVLDSGSTTGSAQLITNPGAVPGSQTAEPSPSPSPSPAPTAAPDTPATAQTGSTGYIKGNNVRFRSGPGLSFSIHTELFYGNAVTVTGVSGDWTAIEYKGQSGYVYSQYVAEGSVQTVSTGGSASGREIADYALSFLGYSYSWGGKSPSTGFDCSGLVYYVYQHFGYTLNRVASEQAKNGRHIEASELQPGDLICFYSGGSYIGHVGIYIGGNRFVHAASSTAGVITSELTGYYATRGFEARRII